jgi:hypothetical protein
MTKRKKNYRCRWLKTVGKTMYEFTIRAFPALIRNDQRDLEQRVTATSCHVSTGLCIPKEAEEKVMVWKDIPRLPHLLQFMGQRGVYISKGMVTIPSLSIGGGIVHRDKDSITLDSAVTIVLNNKTIENLGEYPTIVKDDKSLKPNAQTDHFSAEIIRALIELMEQVKSLAETMCEQESLLGRLKLEGLTGTISRMEQRLSLEKGIRVTRQGERMQLERCEPIEKYTILWGRDLIWNNTIRCYKELPIRIKGKVQFIHLPTHIVHNLGQVRPCRTKHPLYMIDRDYNEWKLSGKDIVQIPRITTEQAKEFAIPPLMEYKASLARISEPSIPIEPLLDTLLNDMEEMKAIQPQGNDDDNDMDIEGQANKIKEWANKTILDPVIEQFQTAMYIAGGIMSLIIMIGVILCLRKHRRRMHQPIPSNIIVVGHERNGVPSASKIHAVKDAAV